MGFWKVMSNMAQGKPAFEVPDDSKEQSQAVTDQNKPSTPPTTAANGQKIIPQLSLEHCKPHVHGSTMLVTAWITNTSEVEIELDKVTMLGQKIEIDRRLTPQQSHEIQLYKGQIPTNDSSHKANIYYKTFRDGDYFCADYMIEYSYEDDGTYVVEYLHPENYGVRDI